jgi:hypothetical protein
MLSEHFGLALQGRIELIGTDRPCVIVESTLSA